MESVSSVPELELMQKIFEGDVEAVEGLYDKYAPLLYTFIKKIVRDKDKAEEALESFFFTICKKINYFDFETRNSYTWIITLAKNRAVYDLRKEKSEELNEENSIEPENDFIVPRLSHLSEPLDLEKALEYKNKIESALNSLTDAQQFVIYLSFYEGLTQDEIAERLKIPLQTVESKIKISLIKLNGNFEEGLHSSFPVKNPVIDLIYPFVLGCLKDDKVINTYNNFKSSEMFPWKLLGKYQNLVSLLPVILDLEIPPEKLKEKIINQFKKPVEEIDIGADSVIGENQVESNESQNEDQKSEEEEILENQDEIVVTFRNKEEKEDDEREEMFKSIEESIEGIKHIDPEYVHFVRRRSHAGLITFIFILVIIIMASVTYLFYEDRSDYYQNEIDTLNEKLQEVLEENQNKPEIPGIGELNKPQTVELKNTELSPSGAGKVILSFQDKKGYLYIQNLPLLTFDNAYQLWGKFNGDLVSLGLFKVSKGPDYYPFTLPPFVANDPAEFFLVESTEFGSRSPGDKIYLRGKFK